MTVDVQGYFFRGDDSYQGGPVGLALGKDADAAVENVMATQVQPGLVASGNTYNPSLIVLRQKGYDLWLEKGDDCSLWFARKGDQTFLAYTGPELLGLVVLWESFGKDWNQQEPDIYGELSDKLED